MPRLDYGEKNLPRRIYNDDLCLNIFDNSKPVCLNSETSTRAKPERPDFASAEENDRTGYNDIPDEWCKQYFLETETMTKAANERDCWECS